MSDNFPTDDGIPFVPVETTTETEDTPEPVKTTPAPNRPDVLPNGVPDFIQELREDQASIGKDNRDNENKRRRWKGLDRLPE